jgi:hypothetical protein
MLVGLMIRAQKYMNAKDTMNALRDQYKGTSNFQDKGTRNFTKNLEEKLNFKEHNRD